MSLEDKIGFNEVRAMLHGYCLSPLGHERVDAMQFLTEHEAVTTLHLQLAELSTILQTSTELPDQDFFDLRPEIHRLRIEGTYLEEQTVWELLRALRTLHGWVAIVREKTPSNSPLKGERHEASPLRGGLEGSSLEKLAEGVFTFNTITRRIEQILDKFGRIKDEASSELATIRRELKRAEGSVSRTLTGILKAAQAEGLVEKDVTPAMRDGRLVIPVAPALKRRIKGIIHDESATGKTVFIEPAEVVEANNRIRELEADEKREMIRILREFTELLRPNIKELLRGFEFLADIEFLLVKHHLTKAIGALSPEIYSTPLIDWFDARHPLLEAKLRKQGEKIVPLCITLNKRQRILIISGPNAGGKSVCLKTVGLLQYMLQCGLPVPMADGSRAGIFRRIFIDIGDEQSIEDDLSTYSSHLLNMKRMMAGCAPNTLLLIDEFGGGTEPTIGGAIAEAVLKRFVSKGTFAVITTHYQNLKHFAEDTPGVVNGAMLYDRQKMAALFQLQIGNPGSSFAVEIARKIGIPEEVIADATELVGQEYVNADKYLLDITRDKRYWEGKRQTIHSQEKQMEQTIEQYEREIEELRAKRKEIIRQAKAEAEKLIAAANAQIENTIREIKEAQADKERTRSARQQLQTFRDEVGQMTQEELDAYVEKKRRQIEGRRQRHKERQEEKKLKNEKMKELGKEALIPNPLSIGETVRIKGQTSVGTITDIEGKQATVTFGMMRTLVDIKRLEPADKPSTSGKTEGDRDRKASLLGGSEEGTGGQVNVFLSRQTQDSIRQKHLNFRQEIDVRGMRADEALQAVTYFIDDALMVNASRVRILHGTGTGALRQVIRQYLATVPGVTSAHDEHVQFGGAGITVVEFR
ncbi:MAG: Smr/MutS family protein [Bacteroidaceae bacterium]|nr:Smr/MutS family protein [Bacteroidaceae bacterium]